ncbi:TonB-dependent siderophore receptor [Sphingosinicella sp.]|uniref:TonB-dependent receptor n=1 Tax=Sphingosinicella sp. TaxID=1917971 RepID=UPI00184286CB|nr:TonB-dependent siderophore receptor [Sphingosinicella sp.]MBA4759333.1 TonB-dependent siderophore receptor [Sphingosinicella sp.]
MKILFAALLAATAATPAIAADEIESEIVVTGNKFSGDFGEKSGIPIDRLPQSVQIVTADDIIESGARSISDLLRGVPSANAGSSRVSAYQSFTLKVRGFLADQMRNGMRQRYYEDVDASALSNIERVEVLKGPSGVLYGQSAVGGIISIVTKRPQAEPAANFSATFGSFDQKVVAFDMTGGVAPGLSIRATGEVERSNTFVDFQDMDRVNGGLSLHYAGEGFSANLVAEYTERKTSRYPGLPVVGTVVPNGGEWLRRGLNLGEPAADRLSADAPLVQAWVDVKLADGWTLTPRIQYQEFNSSFLQIRLRAPVTSTIIGRNGRIGREDDAYTIAQLDLAGTLKTGLATHKLLLGYEYDRERGRFTQYSLDNVTPIDVTAPVYTYDTAPPATSFAFDSFYNIDGHAVYLQDQVSLTDRWDVVGAVRHSWVKASSGDWGGPAADRTPTQSTIWQIGSTYRVSEQLSVYAGYNTGFDVESSAGARAADGKPLKPEESNQLEAGLRFRHGDFRASFAAFRIKRVNALTVDLDNPDFSINVGAQRVQGVELEGEWQPVPWWTLSAGYALLDSKITRSNDGDQGLRLGDVPRHTITARTAVAVPGTPLMLRAAVNHVGSRLLVNGSAVSLPAYTIADLGAGLRAGRFTIDATVSNLFDKLYYTASGNGFAVNPGDPRTFSIRVGVGF